MKKHFNLLMMIVLASMLSACAEETSQEEATPEKPGPVQPETVEQTTTEQVPEPETAPASESVEPAEQAAPAPETETIKEEVTEAKPEPAVEEKKEAAPSRPVYTIDVLSIYRNKCAACHNNGVAGAPKPGDKAEWDRRLEQGRDKVYESAIKGKGAMPPRGGSSLSDDDLRQVIDFMITGI